MKRAVLFCARIAALAAVCGGAMAAAPAEPGGRQTEVPNRAEGMQRMGTRVSADFRHGTVGEAVEWICAAAGLECEVFWEAPGRGLDRDAPCSVRLSNATIEAALERILMGADGVVAPTWQLRADGVLQIGCRERLNRFCRVEIYAIADLLREVPDYRDAVSIDPAAALGGERNIFCNWEPAAEAPSLQAAETPAARLVRLLTTLIEPDQWGGERGATIEVFGDTLIVKAPGYIHRQIGGVERERP